MLVLAISDVKATPLPDAAPRHAPTPLSRSNTIHLPIKYINR